MWLLVVYCLKDIAFRKDKSTGNFEVSHDISHSEWQFWDWKKKMKISPWRLFSGLRQLLRYRQTRTWNSSLFQLSVHLKPSSSLFLANNDKSLNNNLVFGPISTILGRKVDIVGQCVLNLYISHVDYHMTLQDGVLLAFINLLDFPLNSQWVPKHFRLNCNGCPWSIY